ncbi:uncharacterized protein LOC141529739 [Cotesia typhae]|uniref:uncharacterized protein LOC141529739 n=1 Tax=Cotesia typhae TaxID=2053667 RepID=UPI003D681A78
MLIVANTEFEDSIIAVDNNCMTPLDARKRLEGFISDKNIKVADSDLDEPDSDDKILLDKLSNFDTDHLGWSVSILTWVDNLSQKANTIIFTGSNLNSFRVRGLYDRLLEKIKEFPIFTNICTPETMSRGTSCFVEGDFKDLKLDLEQQVKLPTTILKFLKLHISQLLGGICIFRAKVNKLIVDNQFKDDMNECEHGKWFENWKGQGKEKTARNAWTAYENPTKEENDEKMITMLYLLIVKAQITIAQFPMIMVIRLNRRTWKTFHHRHKSQKLVQMKTIIMITRKT